MLLASSWLLDRHFSQSSALRGQILPIFLVLGLSAYDLQVASMSFLCSYVSLVLASLNASCSLGISVRTVGSQFLQIFQSHSFVIAFSGYPLICVRLQLQLRQPLSPIMFDLRGKEDRPRGLAGGGSFELEGIGVVRRFR